jgi:hypothetical protein
LCGLHGPLSGLHSPGLRGLSPGLGIPKAPLEEVGFRSKPADLGLGSGQLLAPPLKGHQLLAKTTG